MVPVKEAGSMSFQVPVLTPINYPVWAVKVKAIMDANGVWETVEPRALGAEPDEKKAKQALAFLFQDIPEEMVLQMASYTDPKQVWDGLKTRYLGVDWVRAARLATLRRELETMRMKEGEAVDDFVVKLNRHSIEAVGRLKAYEERMKSHEEKEGERYSRGRGRGRSSDIGGRGRGRGSGRGDKIGIRCYDYGVSGHFSYECMKWNDKDKEANLIEENEPTLL
ncbi:uncharacterized protein LOC110920090 [Helianthus annuus]|uniref:uncharacterized protein LOC110920090 n=1 Tax=Helianthus annuus TaxID=4232 RepID=UPI000B903BE6|nr:uncharacterized protein LOC110920090 [Helianthus annuus]